MISQHIKIKSILLNLEKQTPLFRYGLATLSVLFACIATQTIPVIGHKAVFLIFFFATTQCAFWLGMYPGIFALYLSFVAVNVCAMLPLWISNPRDALILNTGYSILSAIFIATTGFYRTLIAELLERQQDSNHAQEIGQTGIWRLDIRHNVLRWTEQNYRIFGIPAGTPLTYEMFLSTLHPEDRDYVDQKWQAAMKGEPYDIEHRIIVADQVKWIKERAKLEFDEEGNLLGGFGTSQDITNLKLTQQQLRESQYQYAQIIESAMDAIITIDENHLIRVFNKTAEKMFGCPANEAIGSSLSRFIPEQFSSMHQGHVRAFGNLNISSRKMGSLGTISGLRSNGEEFPIEVSITKTEYNGIKSYTAILRDVSERLINEQLIKEQLNFQDKLSKIAASAPGLICSFRLSPDGKASMPYASTSFESLYGLHHESVAEDFSPVLARIHPEDSEHVNASIAESARTMQAWRETFRYNHPSKGERWIEGSSMPQREEDDSIIWHGYLQDVTERKFAEKAVAAKESELRLIMDATPALLSYLDTDFRYLRINKTYENWFCLHQDQILGHKAQEVLGEKAWTLVGPNLERARAGERVSFDYRVPYGTGMPRWVHGNYIPDKDANGNVIGVVVHVTDIDDRKQAELERQKFVSLADNSQEFIGMCDMNFMPIYVNAAGMELLGLDNREQAFKTPVQEFFFPEDQRFIKEEFFPRVIREKRAEVEIRFRHFKTGAALWMLYNVFYISDDKGEAVGLATVSRNITARKLVEASLQESEARLLQAKNAALLGIFDQNLVSKTLKWDDRVCELWGINPNETVTLRKFLSRLHPDDRANVKAAAARAFDPSGNGEYNAEFRITRRTDNRLFWIDAIGTTTFANGRPIRLIGYVQDITARRQAEAALAESQRQNRLMADILEHADQPFCVGYSDGKMEHVNLALEKLTGYNSDELLALDWKADLTPSEWHAIEYNKLEELHHNKKTVRYEKEYIRKDGTRVPVELMVEMLPDEAGLPTRYYAFITDLTERKQAQAALRKSKERELLASQKHLYELQSYQAELELQNQELRTTTNALEISRSHYLELYDFAPAGYLSLTEDAIIAESNLTISNLLGLTHAQLVNRRFVKLIPKDYQEQWQLFFQHAKNQQGKKTIELPMRKGDGSTLVVHMECQFEKSEEKGGQLRLALIDITDRTLAETALRQSEERMRLATETTGVGIWEWNVLTNRIRWDAQMFRIYGIAPTNDGFIDYNTWSSTVVPEDLAQQEAILQNTAKQGGQSTRGFRIFRLNDKATRYIQAVETDRKNDQGQIEWVVGSNLDVTESTLAEKALLETKTRLKLGIQVAEVALTEVDYSTNLAHLTAEAARIYGLGKTAMTVPRETVQATFHPDDRAEIIRQTVKSLDPAGNGLLAMDHRIVWPDGTVRWLRIRKQVFFTGEGKSRQPYRATLALHDITTEKNAVEAVRTSEAYVRGVLNSLPENVAVLDNQGKVMTVNEPWLRFARANDGTKDNVSVGANYLEVCRRSSAAGDAYAQEALKGLESLLAGTSQEFTMEYPCATPHQHLWFYLLAKRVTQGLEGIIITHVDITELKQTESDLRDFKARLALVIEEVNAGYWDWDLTQDTLYLSPEWKRQLGYNEKESLNPRSTQEDHLHPDDRDLVRQATENFISGKSPEFDLQFRLRHKDGSYRWIHCRGALIRDENGHPVRMLGLNLDITDFKHSKEIIENRDAMEKSFRTYVASQTAATIAHELNQPLSAIAYYSFVAQNLMTAGNKNPEKLVEIMEKCGQQAQRAGDVMQQLLTLLHKGDIVSEEVDINKSVKLSVEYVKANDQFSDIDVELNLAAELPPVNFNTLQMQKVLFNLLNNGLESMRASGTKNGKISVTTCPYSKDPSMALISVRDSGKGMDDIEKLNQIFQPFYTTKTSGLGMGLAISLALIEAHGGKMWAEQNADAGLTIHFTLPFA